MTFMKPIILFIMQNGKKLKRKWLTLPLLLLFPIIIIGLITTIAFTFVDQKEQKPIQVGLVDQDESEETQLVVKLIEESAQLGSYINIQALSKSEAKKNLQSDQLSGYITFPEGFTSDLYNGHSVTLPITGNTAKRTDSYLIKELLDSVSRHIRAAQANILTINHYAKQLPIDTNERNDMLFKQFTNFIMYTIGKDKLIKEESVTNHATNSPMNYYMLAGWFVIVTIWLIAFYSFLTDNTSDRMNKRMRLYGVIELQSLLAKIVMALVLTTTLAGISLFTLQHLLDLTLYQEDYFRIGIIILLYNMTFLEGLAILETLIRSQKLRLLIQSAFSLIILLLGGAFIPLLYFPMYIQTFSPYIFAAQAFTWLQEIVLNERFYADYLPLALMAGAGLSILIAISLAKERLKP